METELINISRGLSVLMHDLKQSISLQLQNYTKRVNYYTWKLSNQASNLGTAAICSGINCGGKFLLYCWFQEGEEGFQGQVEGQEQHQGE